MFSDPTATRPIQPSSVHGPRRDILSSEAATTLHAAHGHRRQTQYLAPHEAEIIPRKNVFQLNLARHGLGTPCAYYLAGDEAGPAWWRRMGSVAEQVRATMVPLRGFVGEHACAHPETGPWSICSIDSCSKTHERLTYNPTCPKAPNACVRPLHQDETDRSVDLPDGCHTGGDGVDGLRRTKRIERYGCGPATRVCECRHAGDPGRGLHPSREDYHAHARRRPAGAVQRSLRVVRR